MAAEWDILPFEPQMIKDSVMSAVRRWLDDGLNQYNPVKEALSAIQLILSSVRPHILYLCRMTMLTRRVTTGDISIIQARI
jgi:hypothetical protein